jgi:integrase
MANRKRKSASDKPAKPYPDFPLFPHATKRWAKKIRGKLYYFGSWADGPQAALDKYLAQKDDLHAGRLPRQEKTGFTVADLGNAFLNHKRHMMEGGELSPRTWQDYKDVTDLLVEHFGRSRLVSDLRQEDFVALRVKLSRRWGLVRLANTIQRIRSIFKYAYDAEHVDKPVRFGPGFVRPSKKTMRIARSKEGPKLFTREEIHQLLGAASMPMRAMILLAVNCGFGNADVGRLPRSVLDLDSGWVTYAREKTGVDRRCPLWPETVQALRVALADRYEPRDPDHAGLVFITKQRGPWHIEKLGKDGRVSTDSPVAKMFAKLRKALHINGRKGLGFYTLRHVHRTVADEAKDQPAADRIMGHESADMSTQYREKISDERLEAVADHVRAWLFASPAKDGDKVEAELQESAAVEEQHADDKGDDDSPAVLAFPSVRIA